jgi:hypothetical protein
MAKVPFQMTPTEQLRVGSAPQMSATDVRPMDDTVTDDIQRSSKAFNQFAQIAKTIQLEKDDAKSKELSNEYQTRALEIENSYLTLEQGNAVAQVGTGDDGQPIFAYDQKINELNALKEEIAGKAENKNQLAIFNEKAAASLYSSTNRMSKHSLAEQTKYANTNALADINNTVIEASLSVDDFNLGQDSEYVKNLVALDVKIKNYAEQKGLNFDGDSKGSEKDSESYINIRNGFLNEVHDSAIEKLMQGNEYRKVKEYLDWNEKNGTISSAQLNKHMKTVTLAIKKENSEDIVESIISSKDLNTNDGNATSSINLVMSLESSNNINNKNGLPYQEGNGKEITFKNLENLQNTSKFYRADATVSLPPEHRSTHLFLTKELGVEKADSIFTKATTLLKEEGFVIDKEKMKIDPVYAAEVNSKLIEKTMAIGKVELTKKYGVGNELDIANKDLDFVVSKIDYTYAETQQPQIRVGEDGVFNLEDALKRARNNIQDETVLEYVETALKNKHTEQTGFAEENYKLNVLQPLEKIAYAKPGGWIDIKAEDWEKLKFEDRENLQKGYAKSNDRNTLIAIETGEINIFDEKAKNYQSLESLRYLMTEEKYQEYALEVAGVKSGSGSGSGSSLSGSVSVDKDMFDKNLANYKFETKVDLLKNKGKPGDDYLDIKDALKKEIFKFEKDNGVKPNYEQKEALLQGILADKVFLAGKGRFRPVPISAVDLKDQKKVYVKVGGKRIFMKDIPDAQEKIIIESILKTGLPVTQQRIAEYWVDAGMPKTDSIVETTQGIGEIKGPTYGMMAG